MISSESIIALPHTGSSRGFVPMAGDDPRSAADSVPEKNDARGDLTDLELSAKAVDQDNHQHRYGHTGSFQEEGFHNHLPVDAVGRDWRPLAVVNDNASDCRWFKVQIRRQGFYGNGVIGADGCIAGSAGILVDDHPDTRIWEFVLCAKKLNLFLLCYFGEFGGCLICCAIIHRCGLLTGMAPKQANKTHDQYKAHATSSGCTCFSRTGALTYAPEKALGCLGRNAFSAPSGARL